MQKEETTKFGCDLPVEYHRRVKLYCAQNRLKVKDFFVKAIDMMIQKEKEEKKEN